LNEHFITANAGNDITIDQHQTVHFDGTNSSADPTIINYTWNFTYDFNDVLLYGSTPSYTFNIPGNYTVILVVRNELGSTAFDRVLVTVRDPDPSVDAEPPVANAGPDDNIPVGTVFTFNGSGSHDNVGIVNHTWSFVYDARNVLLYGMAPAFRFDIPGIYIVALDVSDEAGNQAVDTLRLAVKDESWPTAVAGDDIIIDQHEIAHLDGRGSFDNVEIVDYTWSFVYRGETVFLYGAETEFQFDDAREYFVTLNVTDDEGNWDTDTINVVVRDIMPPLAVAGDDITIDAGDKVFFNGLESSDNVGVVNYTWTFRYDDTIYKLYGENPSFTFDIPGTYTITLTVRDSEGNIAMDNLTVIVLESEPPIDIDSDGDGFNDTHENASGSDPYDPLSTPLDLDGDGWKNTIETQVGTDPRNSQSVPPDMDGDGITDTLDPDRDGDNVLNDEDAYPDDGERWEREEEGGGAVWWIVGIVGALVVLGIVVGVVVVGRRKQVSGEDRVREEGDVGGDGVDELDGVGKGFGVEEGMDAVGEREG